jgi:hypothetical protein
MSFSRKSRLFISISTILLVSAGWAALQSQPLLKVTRSDDASFLNEISLNLNPDGDLVTLGVSLEKSPVTPQQLQKGFVLNWTKGIETVRLTSGPGFNLKSGGPLTIRFLKQFRIVGANDYGEFHMHLVREGGRWLLRDQHHQDFNQLRMTAHSRGISTIIPVNAGASAQIQSWIDEALFPANEDRGEESRQAVDSSAHHLKAESPSRSASTERSEGSARRAGSARY